MTIDGINISTYGFFLSDVQGLYDHPARKKTIAETGVEAKDIVFVDGAVTVYLSGLFDSYSALRTGVDSLLLALRGERSYSFPNYSILVRGFVLKGAKVDPDLLKVNVVFNITG